MHFAELNIESYVESSLEIQGILRIPYFYQYFR